MSKVTFITAWSRRRQADRERAFGVFFGAIAGALTALAIGLEGRFGPPVEVLGQVELILAANAHCLPAEFESDFEI